MALLEVKHINAGYGKKQVIYDVSFEVEQSEIALLIGSNGSGKSTVLKSIYGLVTSHSWEHLDHRFPNPQIIFDGEDIIGLHPSQLISKGLMYIPQKNFCFENLTVKENLEVSGIVLNDRQLFKERFARMLDEFHVLKPYLKRTPSKMSGGERQLLAMAMTMLHKPKLLMLDEPFNGLSPHAIAFVRGVLKMLNQRQGVTVLMVEHRVKESYVIAQKIIGLNLGKIHSIREVNSTFALTELNAIFV
jgi:branched-chain amino acid transport system ATP-binding protein